MIGQSKINERLHDMISNLNVTVLPEKIFFLKRYNKHLIYLDCDEVSDTNLQFQHIFIIIYPPLCLYDLVFRSFRIPNR